MIYHEVLTTEKVPFRYPVAGLGSRLLAWLIDTVLWILLVLMGWLLVTPLEMGRQGLGQAALVLWVFLLLMGYGTLFEWLWQGQTPGKRIMGIRAVCLDGTAMGFSQSAARNLLRLVDNLTLAYGSAFLASLGTPERRRLGDLAAGTLVVRVEERALSAPTVAEDGDVPERQAELRARVGVLGREQQQTLLDVCARREQLKPVERARLFEAIARFLGEQMGVEPDEHESDEKFVLRLAALLNEEGPRRGSGRMR
jgi:uncharacterized RDD family membrane protein YckC